MREVGERHLAIVRMWVEGGAFLTGKLEVRKQEIISDDGVNGMKKEGKRISMNMSPPKKIRNRTAFIMRFIMQSYQA